MTTDYPTRRTGLGRSVADIVRASEHPRRGGAAGRLLSAPAVLPLDLVPFPMLVADPVGRVLAVNQRWVRLTGLAESESTGSGWLAALRPQDRSEAVSLVQAVGAGSPGTRSEFGLRSTGAATFGWWLVAHERAGERLVGLAIGEVSRDPSSRDPVVPDPVVGDVVESDPVVGDPVVGDPVVGDPGEGDPVLGELPALLRSLKALLDVLDVLVCRLPRLQQV